MGQQKAKFSSPKHYGSRLVGCLLAAINKKQDNEETWYLQRQLQWQWKKRKLRKSTPNRAQPSIHSDLGQGDREKKKNFLNKYPSFSLFHRMGSFFPCYVTPEALRSIFKGSFLLPIVSPPPPFPLCSLRSAEIPLYIAPPFVPKFRGFSPLLSPLSLSPYPPPPPRSVSERARQ